MSNVTLAELMLPRPSRPACTVIVADALLPAADIGGTSLSGSMRVRNTAVSSLSAKTGESTNKHSKTARHNLFIDSSRRILRGSPQSTAVGSCFSLLEKGVRDQSSYV